MNRLFLHAYARLLRLTPAFRGKHRFENWWCAAAAECFGRAIRDLGAGRKIECDLHNPYDCMVYLQQEEQWDLQFAKFHLLPLANADGGTPFFLDIGANIGLWSLILSTRCDARVAAFEPNPTTFARLDRNVRVLNGLTPHQVAVVQSAVGDRNGTIGFATAGRHNVAHVVETATEGACSDLEKAIQVPLLRLDSWWKSACQPGDYVAGMKIDVEGFEHEVLAGAEAILDQHPWLVLEFNPECASTGRLGDWNCHTTLSKRGYVAYGLARAPFPKLKPLSDAFETKHYLNVLYWPKNRRFDFQLDG